MSRPLEIRRPDYTSAELRSLGRAALRRAFGVMRNALAHAGKTRRRVVSAFVGTAFAQDDEWAVQRSRYMRRWNPSPR